MSAKKTSAKKTPAKKKAAPKKKAAKKKAAPKKAAPKKAAPKKAAKKKAAPKKRAAKKKAAPKKATPKTVANKKTAKKQAASTTRKKAAKKRTSKKAAAPVNGMLFDSSPEAIQERPDGESAVVSPEAPVARVAEDAAEAGPTSVGLTRGRRRLRHAPARAAAEEPAARARRDIPPLPDEDEEFVPAEPAPERARRRRPRRRRTPGVDRALVQKLAKVRNGDLHISELDALTENEVQALARHAGLRPRPGESASETIFRLVNEADASESAPRRGRPARAEPEETLVEVEGLLELHPDGYGFLRRAQRNYSQHPEDVYVAAGLVRRLQLKPGHWISGKAQPRRPGQAQLALQTVDEVNHEDPARVPDLVEFDKLTVVYPDQRLHLETAGEDIEMRIMDLFCPLGRGQRGLIVAPPRTGKTVMLTKLADAIATNSPDVDIVVLLVDERPEEVTNMRRSVRGEVIASTFDKPASNHIRVAELVMDKVKRMVEFGRHVVLLLDSITRMGRAYNNQTGGSGRILTGGLDAKALSKPKRFFGSARNVEDGGSLTIVATALVDTGSRMDEVIFEEFKGTGNMELVLSRDLADARIWPAIDVPKSATRNEDLLMHPDELRRVTLLRRGITGQEPQGVLLALREQMRAHTTNAEFLMQLGG